MRLHPQNPLSSRFRTFQYYMRGLWQELSSKPVVLWCQAIAFKVLVTVAPLLLLATGIVGLVLRQGEPYENVTRYLNGFLPRAQRGALLELMSDLQRTSGTLTVFGGAALALSVITLFGTLRYVIAHAMLGEKRDVRPVLPGLAFDLRMMFQVGVLFILSFALTFGVNTLHVHTTAWGVSIGLDPLRLENGWASLLWATSLLVPWSISVAMFAQLFYFIPLKKPLLRSALVGATVAAILFEVAKNGFTLYLRFAGRDIGEVGSGGADALGSLGGVFALVIAFVFWAYVSALILIIGAFVTQLRERLIQTSPADRWALE